MAEYTLRRYSKRQIYRRWSPSIYPKKRLLPFLRLPGSRMHSIPVISGILFERSLDVDRCQGRRQMDLLACILRGQLPCTLLSLQAEVPQIPSTAA